MNEEIQKDLFDPNLFMVEAGEPMLKGCRCSNCQKVFFPPRNRCSECLSPDVSPIPLGANGRLYSYTTVHIPSKHFKPPYMIGYLELESGIRVFGQIRLKKGQPMKMGQPMKVVVDYLWQEKDGQKVAAYLFEPDDR